MMEKYQMHALFKKLLLLTFFFACVVLLPAQNVIIKSPELEHMLALYAQRNKNQETIKAWRIQVAALSDRREMEKEKIRFENIFPYYRLEWIHDNPYYILKIKDAVFKQKLDALTLLHRIKRRYPSALVILDDVKPDKILNPNF
ncbi:MAG: SPOR domain-containing protein [Saprospiraceae bacterium]|nr:SPOR domain-containing protein [Saprospiraceae bacterium]